MRCEKVALITGSTGISLGAALVLAEDLHYDGFILGYNKDEIGANKSKEELMKVAGVKHVVLVKGDLGTRESMKKKVEDFFHVVQDEFEGVLTAFIHSAGDALPPSDDAVSSYLTMYPEFLHLAIEKSLLFLKDGQGKIVVVSSPGCNISQVPRVGYPVGAHAGKAAMEQLVRYYALKVASRRININCVIPGYVDTKEWVKIFPDRKVLEMQVASRVPMQIFLTPKELGKSIAWLCSQDSFAVTGVCLPVDCGLHFVGSQTQQH